MGAAPAARVARFGPTERALHWTFAAGYLWLLTTGLLLAWPEWRAWVRGYTPVVGLRLHLAAAALWIAGPLGVLLVGDRRACWGAGRALAGFRPGDSAWLRAFPRWLVTTSARRATIDREVDRFNAGQKVNALFVAATSALLFATGLVLTAATLGLATVRRPWLASSLDLHRWITYAALAPLAGHIFLAVVFGPTRPALPGMLDGRVPAAWAARHHPRWRP